MDFPQVIGSWKATGKQKPTGLSSPVGYKLSY
jgi:hypothetical protein